MTPVLAQTLAKYNRLMNEKVYALAASLSDEQRKQDQGAFFGSVHGTLNHLLWADGTWLDRFEGLPARGGTYTTEIASEFEALRAERVRMDERLSRFALGLDQDHLAQPFTWTNTKGITRTTPLYVLVAHLFNHQTHHRGQVTTLFSQMKLDIGVTDLPFVIGD